jgi:hypothetical protein
MQSVRERIRKRVLVFNPLKRLVAVFQSVTAAATAFGTSAPSIHDACTGKNISCCELYFRQLDEDKIEIDMLEDLGTLRLEEYDKLVGIKRKYYPNKYMSRVGMEYKKKKKK